MAAHRLTHYTNVMTALARAKGRIVSCDTLLGVMYEGARVPNNPESVLRVVIHNLRRKLPKDAIVTHPWEGYSLKRTVARRWMRQRSGKL
jgi:DNA-binding response OmpR family regulator